MSDKHRWLYHDICVAVLNNASGKHSKDDAKPIAKVSARPRQISLKEENREIAKLKTEIESLERQKLSLTEALTQIQVLLLVTVSHC